MRILFTDLCRVEVFDCPGFSVLDTARRSMWRIKGELRIIGQAEQVLAETKRAELDKKASSLF